MDVGTTLEVASRKAWRAWLRAHHHREREVWLVFHRKGSGRPSLAYDDAVEEALCFGWIDSVVKPLPGRPGARAQRFTPRRKGAPVSELNKARVRRLVRQRRMTKAGLAALAHVPDLLRPTPRRVPDDVRRALVAAPPAWEHFQAFPEAYRRIRLGWIEAARDRPAIFRQRLRYFVQKTQANQRYGMVQE